MKNNTLRYLFVCLALVGFAFVFACQKGQLVEYKKYASDAEVPRISVEDAKKEVDAGTAIIIDTRADSAYKQEHIAGSINFPLGSPDDKFSTLPKGKKLILYCSWGAEHTSASLAFQMNQKEIPGTYALLGGTNAWKTAGYPMEKGE